MESIKQYKLFLEEAREPLYFDLKQDEINIYIDQFIKAFKEKFNFSCWHLYDNRDSVSLQYFKSSNDGFDNMMEIKKFMYEKAPYFRDLIIHRDDNRIVLKFVDPGDPIRFKFYY